MMEGANNIVCGNYQIDPTMQVPAISMESRVVFHDLCSPTSTDIQNIGEKRWAERDLETNERDRSRYCSGERTFPTLESRVNTLGTLQAKFQDVTKNVGFHRGYTILKTLRKMSKKENKTIRAQGQ